MKKLVAAVLVLVVMAASRGAGAAEPEPPAPGTGEGVFLGAGQALAGAGVALGGLMLAGGADLGGTGSLAVVLATPTAVGLAVCGLGKLSSYYEGSCYEAIAFAYVSLLSVVPLAVIGFGLDVMGGDNGEYDGLGGIVLGVAAGWLVAQPVITTMAWHRSKRPRDPGLSFLPAQSRLRAVAPPVVPRGRSRAPGQLTLTLLSAGF